MIPLAAIGGVFSKIPIFWKVVVGAIALGIVCFFIWKAGADSVRVEWEQEKVKLEQQKTELERQLKEQREAGGRVTVQEVVKYVDRVQTVYKTGKTIIKEVPVYVTSEDDSRCTINNGFVRMWNAANKGELPGPAEPSDGAPSAVVLSGVAAQHGEEATQCRAVEEQLISLQSWLKRQCEIHGCYASE